MRNQETRRRRPARAWGRASTVDLSHDNVDAGVDGDDIGEKVAFHHLRNRGEIDEGRRTDSPAHWLGGAVGYHIVALLPLRAINREIRFTDRWTRAFHHDLEVMDHRL